MTTQATVREALHGERGVIDQLTAWLTGEKPKCTSAGEGGPKRPITGRAWFTLDGHTSRELIFDTTYPDPQRVTPEALLMELEESITEQVGTRPVGMLEVKYHEEGRADWAGVKLQRTLKDLTEADIPMTSTFLRGELARYRRQNDQLFAGQQAAFSDLRTLASDFAAQIKDLATLRSTTTAGADLSSPWAPVGMLMLFVLVPVVQKAIGLDAGASLVDTVDRLVDIGKHMHKKQMGTLDGGDQEETGDTPQIPPGAGGSEAPKQITADSEISDMDAAAAALGSAGIDLNKDTAEGLISLMTAVGKDKFAKDMLASFAKTNGVDLAALLPADKPATE